MKKTPKTTYSPPLMSLQSLRMGGVPVLTVSVNVPGATIVDAEEYDWGELK